MPKTTLIMWDPLDSDLRAVPSWWLITKSDRNQFPAKITLMFLFWLPAEASFFLKNRAGRGFKQFPMNGTQQMAVDWFDSRQMLFIIYFYIQKAPLRRINMPIKKLLSTAYPRLIPSGMADGLISWHYFFRLLYDTKRESISVEPGEPNVKESASWCQQLPHA